MSARLIIVAAMDSKRGVGKDGKIPWHAPEDLKRFKAITMGGSVVYGRRTWESLPALADGVKMLPGRYNMLLTTKPFDPRIFDPSGTIASSLYEALGIVEAQNLGPLFVVGGRRVWEEAFQIIEQERISALAYLTQVEGDFHCDTFFPSTMSDWTAVQESPALLDGKLSTKFQVWQKF